ncbi:MAG: hypothetical protein JNM69_20190 [Archangium sp.]|nr:hypothetical protein [Archangium sp.]
MHRLVRILFFVGAFSCDFDAIYAERCDAGLCSPPAGAGGNAAGGNAAGGNAAGGIAAGGNAAGGNAAGGNAAGGNAAGGNAAGGNAAGGNAAGGNAAGGNAAGGNAAGGNSAGGNAAGGNAAGGNAAGGSATAGGASGCELRLTLPSMVPPPDCVPVEVGYTCGGTPTPASVSLQSSYSPMPTVGGGSFFASPNCSGSSVTSVVSPANISFRPALLNGRPLVGQWLLSGSANGSSAPAMLNLQGEVRAPDTRLQVGVCTPLATPTLTGLMTTTPVAFWSDITFDAFTLPSMFAFCGGSTVTISPTTQPIVPSLRANRSYFGTYTLMGTEMGTTMLGLSANFRVTTCMADGGSAISSNECCGASTTLSDGGVVCP